MKKSVGERVLIAVLVVGAVAAVASAVGILVLFVIALTGVFAGG